MNASELSRFMAGHCERIVEHLLPDGKRAAGEWKVGSVDGEAGQSLSVRLSGVKAGVWKDFAADKSGDLLDLWMAVKRLSVVEAMRDAKEFLGVRDEAPVRPAKAYAKPDPNIFRRRSTAVVDWLKSRGLTEETIKAFRIAEEQRGNDIYAVFPFFKDGALVNAKSRNIANKKDMRQQKDAEPCLFGWHLISDSATTAVICEGEIDAMTLYQVGVPALSVHSGAGNHQWIDSDWDRLQALKTIYLCYDDDEPGRKGAGEVAARLGRERCRIVKLGVKDANQWLQDGATAGQFMEALARSKTLDPDELRPLSDFMDDVKDLFYPPPGRKRDPELRIGDMRADWFEFRGGEVSVWTGYNGHGKSLLLNQILLGVAEQRERVCVFSGEMLPAQQGKRMVKQASGIDRPTTEYIDAIGGWLQDRFWLFNVIGSASIDRLCEVFSYSAKRYGIKHFVVDSLMMTDVPDDGAGAHSRQKEAVQKLQALAKSVNGHVHLVAHPRKGKEEDDAPGKLDVAGSSKITDGADNVFSVWSSRKDADDPDVDKPDGYIELHKQRNGDVQHKKVWLWFNRANMQFSSNSKRRPHHYVTYSNQGGDDGFVPDPT